MPSYKVIKSGHIVEIYEYQNTRAKLPLTFEEEYNGEVDAEEEKAKEEKAKEERIDEYRQRTNIRARNNLRRLVNANFDNKCLFITITFAENITDIPFANNEFNKFIKRMKYKQDNFAHASVIEFQKRGAIHYHMICNWEVTWNNHKELQALERDIAKIWGNGFADIQEIKDMKNVDNVGAYLIKYMSKNNIDTRLEGKKRYFHSRNLIQPIEVMGEYAVRLIEHFKDKIPVFTNEYSSEWTGKVMYREYNPLRIDRGIKE